MFRNDGEHVLRNTLDYEDQRIEGLRPKRAWKRQVEEETVKVVLCMERVLLVIKVDCWHQSDCQ